MSNNFFTPKSIFRGRNADGSKFRIEEWDFNSIGNLDGGILFKLLIYTFIMVIVSPLTLIISILTYNGHIKLSNILGILFGGYYLIDIYNNWFFSDLTSILLNDKLMALTFKVNLASIISHIVFLILTTLKGEKFNQNGGMWVLLIIITLIFYSGFKHIGGVLNFKYESTKIEQYTPFTALEDEEDESYLDSRNEYDNGENEFDYE